MIGEMDMYVEVSPNGLYRTNINLDDKCKICKKVTCPIMIDEQTREISYRHYRLCVNRYCLQCKHYFIDEFDVIGEDGMLSDTSFEVLPLEVKPELLSDIVFSDDITLISPVGKEIYLQALKAEQEQLDLIAGIGYRKALEFFVKDFVIVIDSADKDKVIRMPLKTVIDNYIDDQSLKTFATASVFVGNDETHYTRKHIDKDLESLKKYLHGFLHYMDLKLNFLDAQELVNRSKKS